jgi:organic hydroperoxide reductase OsmC/OhrA
MVVAAGSDVERVLRIVEKAHHECYIANSVTSQIVIEPIVDVR